MTTQKKTKKNPPRPTISELRGENASLRGVVLARANAAIATLRECGAENGETVGELTRRLHRQLGEARAELDTVRSHLAIDRQALATQSSAAASLKAEQIAQGGEIARLRTALSDKDAALRDARRAVERVRVALGVPAEKTIEQHAIAIGASLVELDKLRKQTVVLEAHLAMQAVHRLYPFPFRPLPGVKAENIEHAMNLLGLGDDFRRARAKLRAKVEGATS